MPESEEWSSEEEKKLPKLLEKNLELLNEQLERQKREAEERLAAERAAAEERRAIGKALPPLRMEVGYAVAAPTFSDMRLRSQRVWRVIREEFPDAPEAIQLRVFDMLLHAEAVEDESRQMTAAQPPGTEPPGARWEGWDRTSRKGDVNMDVNERKLSGGFRDLEWIADCGGYMVVAKDADNRWRVFWPASRGDAELFEEHEDAERFAKELFEVAKSAGVSTTIRILRFAPDKDILP